MKNTAAFIDAFCARQSPPLTAKEIAARMGLDAAMFPQWRRGEAEHVRHTTLIKMQSGISSDWREQSKLLRAYLRDQCVGPGADGVRVELAKETSTTREEPETGYGSSTDVEPYRGIMDALQTVKPDVKMRTCLERLIRALPGGKHVRKVLLALAEMREN